MRNRLRIGFLVIIVLLWAIGVYWVLSSMKLRDISIHIQDQVFPTIIEMNQMNTQLNEVREVTLAYILLGDAPDVREASKQQLEELYQSLGQFAAKHLAHANVVGSRAREDAQKLVSLSEELILASSEIVSLKDEGVEYGQLSEKMQTDFEPIFWSFKGFLDELIREHEQELLAAQARVANQSDTTIKLILLFSVIATLVAIMVAIIVDRLFLRYLTERKQLEDALRLRAEEWDRTTNAIEDLISVQDRDFRLIMVNKSFSRALKTEAEDLLGKKCHEVVHKTDLPWLNCPMVEVFKDGKTHTTEVKDPNLGTTLLVTASPIFDEKGEIVAGVHIAKDISERRKMEKALEKERYALGERVKELNCLYGLSALVEKENISLEEIIEGTVNLIPPAWQYPEVAASRILLGAQTFKSKNFKETAWKLVSDIVVQGKKTGLLEVVYLKEKPESDEGPFLKEERNLVNALGERLGRIIERKETERELRIKSEAIESSINAIALADLEGRLTYVNHSFLSMWKRSRQEEVLGRPITEFWGTREQSLQIMQAVRSGKGWTGELVAKREDGSSLDVQLMVNIVENTVGKAICMVASVVDITERKRIEQMKDDFVALASHELRTPLTSIQGYAELILDGDVGEISKEQREFLEIISQNTRRLEALINDVLDVEKIESGRMTMKMEKTDLGPIVDSCVNTFKVMAENKGLQLEKDVKTSPINVLGDSDRLSQVLSNLLSNAIKYTKEGRVKIIASIKGEFASIAVEDTGLGMSQEDMKIVFSRFFRAEDSYVRKTTGSGLGLSIAKATIERHNGDIKVESKLGAGSKFEVILPLLKEAKKAD